MPDTAETQACQLAVYMIESGGTVRSAAQKFGISKSTVHKYLCERLEHEDSDLYRQVRKLLDQNKSERHIRGGQATKRKYESENRKRKI